VLFVANSIDAEAPFPYLPGAADTLRSRRCGRSGLKTGSKMMSTRGFLRRSLALAAFIAAAGMSAQAGAVPFHMLFESDTPASSELSLASFASLADAVEGTLSDFSVSALDVTAGFSVGGLVYDGSRFHMLFESDFDAGAGGEISIGSFDSIDAIVDGTLVDFAVTDLDLAPIFSVAGLAFDGDRYRPRQRAAPAELRVAGRHPARDACRLLDLFARREPSLQRRRIRRGGKFRRGAAISRRTGACDVAHVRIRAVDAVRHGAAPFPAPVSPTGNLAEAHAEQPARFINSGGFLDEHGEPLRAMLDAQP
jgi:hypothetical protein